MFSSLAPKREKRKYHSVCYRKWGTHARAFSQTLPHGNSKNEIRPRDRRRRSEERREYGKKYRGHE